MRDTLTRTLLWKHAANMTGPARADLFPSPDHNHGSCVDSAVRRAVSQFEAKGLKFTELRRKVFAEIVTSHHSVGAYDILDRLARKGERLAPISVYRAVDALLEAGVVHRLESRNAFFACHASHGHDARQVIFACEDCGAVAEVDGTRIFAALADAADRAQFSPTRQIIEVTGCCQHCRAQRRHGAQTEAQT